MNEQWSFVGDKSQTNAGCGTPLTRPPTPCAGLCVRQAQGHGVPRLESVACAVQTSAVITRTTGGLTSATSAENPGNVALAE
ncbi:hypothetical protein [Methyloglobulus sp.]|uniref:hypothetical protein n=1 Tax=Methyloglobulus sp. TaxID=2518622 RepID=UPI0032B76ED1